MLTPLRGTSATEARETCPWLAVARSASYDGGTLDPLPGSVVA